MSLKALSDYTFYSRYAQYLPEAKRRETWEEAVTRVFDMHRKKYNKQLLESAELKREFGFAESQVKKKRVLGAQRALQYGGDPILKRNERIYNCSSLLVDKPFAFQQVVWLLLAGCGVGFSVQKHHIAKLPRLVRKPKDAEVVKYVVSDTCEGWADAVGVLLSSYFEDGGSFPEYKGKIVHFDFSEIRPKGSLIAGQFKAPGPEPLKNGLEKINNLIVSEFFASDTVELRPIVAYDILMHSSDFVISGGLRRSATICLFSPDDDEMMKAKTGDWFIKNPQRGRSNNSVVLKRSDTKYEEFKEIFESIKHSGEPGFFFCDDDYATTTNPCVTKDTTVLTSDGIRTVAELIDTQFTAVVDGKEYNTSKKGFWYTGTKQIFKLETAEGYSLRLTDNHKLLCVTETGEEIWKELKDIEIGDKVKLNNHEDYSWGDSNEREFQKGWLTGNLVGDGTFDSTSAVLRYWNNEQILKETAIEYLTKNFKTYQDFKGSTFNNITSITSSAFKEYLEKNFDIIAKDKTPNINIEKQSSKFLEGYVRGLFDADGSVQGNQEKGISIRLTQNNKDVLAQVQRILLRLGIASTIYEERRPEGWYSLPDGNGGMREYFCKALHELVISKKNIITYANRIGFSSTEKKEKLEQLIKQYKRNPYREKFVATVSNIKEDGVEDVYDVTVDDVHRFDANGIIAHNCVEIGFWPVLPNGDSGVNFCNLTEINGKWCTDEEKFLQVCRASAIIGTLQAGYNEFPYLGKTTEEIVRHEALLGCSITGWMDNPDILFDEKILEKGAKEIKKMNEKIAKLIGINPAARLSCSKPAGSTSCVLKTASGIHPHHARRYIRRVQANKQEFPLQHFKANNPIAVEESVWSANNTDEVISFLCEVPSGSITKNQVDAVKLLESVKKAQKHWVLAGNVPERSLHPKVTHNVSNTITVHDDEWDSVCDFIYENRQYFTGVSLLPASGDLDYTQAPFSTVLTPNELVKEYGDASVFASGLVVDGLHAFNNNLWRACDTVLGFGEELEKLKEAPKYPKKETNKALAEYFTAKASYDEWFLKVDWIRRAKQFAERYFEGDIRKATYCLKHVSLWKTWCDLKREYKEVDWTDVEEVDQTYVDADTLASAACVGTKGCEI